MSVRFRLTLVLLMVLVVSRACAETPTIPKSPPVIVTDSLKNIKTICLGYLNGDPIEIGKFKFELKKELEGRGFQVAEEANKCEATLIGALQVNTIKNDPLTALIFHRWITYPAWAQIKLITNSYKEVWKHDFNPKTNLGMQVSKNRKNYDPGDGIKNRAIDIATALATAKEKQSQK